MPLYAYQCETCGSERDEFNRVDERHTQAPECHGKMGIRIYPVMGFVQGGCHVKSPIDGTHLTSMKARSEYMKRNSLVDANDLPAKTYIENENKHWADVRETCAQADKELKASLPKGTDLSKLMPKVNTTTREKINDQSRR